MSQTNCPRCKDPVRFPADLPSEAIVRCPLCAEEYAFSEMEANLPPMVEIVSLPESADEVLSNIDDLLSAKPSGDQVALVTAPRVSASTVRSSARRRPAESPWRPLILLIEIVLSGIVGIALAVLVLWWLPGQWHRDPLSLKPVAAKYAPWLLPPNHRPLTELIPDEDKSPPAPKRSTANTSAKPSSAKPQNEKKESPTSRPASFEEPVAPKDPFATDKETKNTTQKPSVTSETKEPPHTDTPNLDSSSAVQNELATKPQGQQKSDLTKDLPPDHWLNQPEAPPEPPDLVWTSSPEISSLLRDVERRRKDPPKPNFDFPERTEPDFLTTLHELARVAGQINIEDVGLETARTRLNDWLATLSSEEWKAAIEKTAKNLPKDSIAPRGVIYLAKLKAAAAEGSWLHLDLEPNPGAPTFPILIDPTLFHSSGGDSMIGKEIYVLASELPDPKRLVSDVPSSVKKTWLIGALKLAEPSSPSKAEF